MEVNGSSPVTAIFPYIFLCVQQKKEIRTGFKQLEGEYMMAEFHFELNYPFNNLILLKFTHICTCPSTHTHTHIQRKNITSSGGLHLFFG